MLDVFVFVSSPNMAADPYYTDSVFAEEEPVCFDDLLRVVSQWSCWMTWSIVSSPSMATELYHVADNLNKFGFFFDEDTQYYTFQLSHWMTCLVVSSLSFFSRCLLGNFFSKMPPCWMFSFLSVLPIWRLVLSIPTVSLLKRSQFVLMICYVWSLSGHAG